MERTDREIEYARRALEAEEERDTLRKKLNTVLDFCRISLGTTFEFEGNGFRVSSNKVEILEQGCRFLTVSAPVIPAWAKDTKFLPDIKVQSHPKCPGCGCILVGTAIGNCPVCRAREEREMGSINELFKENGITITLGAGKVTVTSSKAQGEVVIGIPSAESPR